MQSNPHKTRTGTIVALVLTALLVAGCNSGTTGATADLRKVSSTGIDPVSVGTATFSESGGTLSITISVKAGSGLSPGDHGVHVHKVGDCGPGPASATNATVVAAGKAGPHFNPEAALHGHHAGDLGNLHVAADGSGTLVVSASAMQVPLTLKSGDKYSVVGLGLVVHAKADDLHTDPSGNSGPRAMCGVIRPA
jgi:Cu-Zn family superoxide dismutase